MTDTISEMAASWDLAGRVALVTGAGGGGANNIGAGIATTLARRGAVVCVNDLTEEGAAKTVDDLRADGFVAHAVTGDVGDPDAAERMVTQAVEIGGGLDILVNNAGVLGRSSVTDTSDEEWARVLRVNLDGPFHMTRAALQVMRDQNYGRVVNIASIAGTRISYLGGVAYTASKAGLLGLTRHAAAEVARYGVTINAVLPGLTITPLIESSTTPERLAKIARMVPSQRAGRPEDIGAVVAFLASEAAGYVSGTAVQVDGALTVLPGDFSGYAENSGKELA